MNIEPLEARIAPAAVLLNPTTATFTDVDGDLVTVKFSKPLLTAANLSSVLDLVIPPGGSALGEQLRTLRPSLNAVVAAGTNIILTARPQDVNGDGVKDGDGLVNVGTIDAVGMDLGAVSIKGDLGAINVGTTGGALGSAIQSLTVDSIGRFGTATGGAINADGTLESRIIGGLGRLTVKTDVTNAWIHVSGPGGAQNVDAKIGSVTIGGSVIGGTTARAGLIEASGDIGAVKIGRDIVGGSASATGAVQSDSGRIASVTLGGSLVGGAASFTGVIRGGAGLGPVKIGGDVRGGAADYSGAITGDTSDGSSGGGITSVTIGGSLLGSGNDLAGYIRSVDDAGPIRIGRDVRAAEIEVGGVGSDPNAVPFTIVSNIASVTVGGSIVGSNLSATGNLGPLKVGRDVHGTAIAAGGDGLLQFQIASSISSITIGGSFNGSLLATKSVGSFKVTGDLAAEVRVFGRDVENGKPALASLSVGGSLSALVSVTGDLGPVKIGRDLGTPSNNSNGTLIGGGSILAFDGRIASIYIGGSIMAGADNGPGSIARNSIIGADHDIGSITVKGSIIGKPDKGSSRGNVVIAARGQETPGATFDRAIGSITVGGSVEFARILGGFGLDVNGQPESLNADAQIGAVKVGGDWVASSLVAGVKNLGADNAPGGIGINADNVNFGDIRDEKINNTSGPILSRIASIIIGGTVAGTSAGGDHFGFSAQQIGSFKVAGFSARLTGSLDAPIPLSRVTADVTLREV